MCAPPTQRERASGVERRRRKSPPHAPPTQRKRYCKSYLVLVTAASPPPACPRAASPHCLSAASHAMLRGCGAYYACVRCSSRKLFWIVIGLTCTAATAVAGTATAASAAASAASAAAAANTTANIHSSSHPRTFGQPKAATAAVCIAGQYRTFSTTSVTFARNFLHPTYTFFLSIGDEEQVDMDAAQRLSLTEERIARTACIPPPKKAYSSPCSNRSVGYNYVQLVCQALKIGACVPLIERHVDTTESAFEYVVHVRPDHRWLQPVPHVGLLWRRHSLKYRVLAWDDHIHIAKYRDGLALFRAAPLAYSMCAGPKLWAAACNTTQRYVQLRMAMQKPPTGFFERRPWNGPCFRPNADPQGFTWTCSCVSIDLWFFIAFQAAGMVRDCGGIWALRCGLTMVDVPPHRAYASLGGNVKKPSDIPDSAWNNLSVVLSQLMSGSTRPSRHTG